MISTGKRNPRYDGSSTPTSPALSPHREQPGDPPSHEAGDQVDGAVRLLVVVWGLGLILHLSVYLLLGPPPYHWYYGPAIGALIMLAVLGVAGLSTQLRWAGL